MESAQDQNDVILSRINLQLARSRSILDSWLPKRAEGEDEQDEEAIDNDEDFVTYGEKAGIEIKSGGADETALPTRPSAPKDKLLEQLIGKKAANAKRKQDAHKSMSTSRHAAPKPMANRGAKETKRQEESEDEGESRAAMLKSRKGGSQQVERVHAEEVAHGEDEDEESNSSGVQARAAGGQDGNAKRPSVTAAATPAERKGGGGSYLDELLAKKGKKKKKQKG